MTTALVMIRFIWTLVLITVILGALAAFSVIAGEAWVAPSLASNADKNAAYEGAILLGKEDEFFDRVQNELEPLWRQFPNVGAVRLQRIVNTMVMHGR